MKILPNINQWKSWSLPSKLSYLGIVTSVAGLLIISISLIDRFNIGQDKTINEKIEELNKMQEALATLDNYLENQEQYLERIAKQKKQMESEKSLVEKALKIDKENLVALIEYQKKGERSSIWIERIFSFLIGVLSSSVATFITLRIQKNKTKTENNV